MTKFELLSKTKNGAYYHVKDASVALLNSLRRTINNKLPTFAIDEVTFFENTSALFNEYIAHRLALIPLKFDPNASPDVKITFSLEATGPTVVYSKDLKSTDEKIIPALSHVPIIVLGENQLIRFEAVAIRGTGSEHAKFQNSHASYSHYPELKIKGSKGDAVKFLPKGSVDEEGKVLRPEKLDVGQVSENVSVLPREGEFIFLVESYNGENPAEILARAITVLREKTDELKTELK
ncbi:MAG: DNA-directed RNA polymerase subunit D [Candidatus Micrarchaeota archaeon]|nr:DNA-directed RNA polymerase subunit D [Candidatus Micrarchaeota archaeon]